MTGKAGFTLVELIVVILIVGILAGVAVPGYMRAMENNRADGAAAVIKMVGSANHIYAIDNGVYTAGLLSGTCACAVSALPCVLVGCRYVTGHSFGADPYNYYTADPNAGASTTCGGAVAGLPSRQWRACAKRKPGAAPGTNLPPYNTWGYGLDVDGNIYGVGANIPAQKGL